MRNYIQRRSKPKLPMHVPAVSAMPWDTGDGRVNFSELPVSISVGRLVRRRAALLYWGRTERDYEEMESFHVYLRSIPEGRLLSATEAIMAPMESIEVCCPGGRSGSEFCRL